MKQFFLKRVSNTDHGVFGVLMEGAIPFAVTLEPPWRDNKENESCIPVEMYRCEKYVSPQAWIGMTFKITGVEGRSDILFHKGNLDDDTLGCVLIGEMFEPLNGIPGIQKSGKGFSEFMQRLDGEDRFALSIMWA